MKVLVVGGGSIGLRHLKNLKTLQVDDLGLVETDPQRLAAVQAENEVRGFSEIEQGLAWSPDIAVICTPPHQHLAPALLAANAGAHLFIEKPLAASEAGLDELIVKSDASSLTTMVGCNMRFHPGPRMVKEIIDGRGTGQVLFSRLESGSYLPEWRPQRDFRETYSARSELGGGCLLDCVHEIDLAQWLFGDFDELICMVNTGSSLGIDVEEIASITARHTCGILSEIHLDYVQRSYERGIKVVGTDGTVIWDHRRQTVEQYSTTTGKWTVSHYPTGWDVNDMYLDEMRYFLDCVRDRTVTMLPLSEARSVLRVALAAKESAGKCVPIRPIPLTD